jgi:hypothetical protein
MSIQITLRGMSPELEAHLRRLAETEGISLNRAALRLMADGAGLRRPRPDVIGSSLDDLIGTWSADDERELSAHVGVFETIDENLWR